MIINGWEVMNTDRDLEHALMELVHAWTKMCPEQFHGPSLDVSLKIIMEVPAFKPEPSKFKKWRRDYIKKSSLLHGFNATNIYLKDGHVVVEFE